MADYKFVVARGTQLLGELRWLSANVNLRLYDPSDAVLTINGRDATSVLLEPFTTDVVVYRNGVKVLRGTVGATTDSITQDSHYTTVNVVDYRARFDRRILLSDSNHNNEPDMDIVWDLITDAQSATNGGMGVTQGTVPAGVDRKLTFLAGETLREAIDLLAGVEDGFDWDIDPDLKFVAWRNGRGESRQRTLDYGGAVSEVSISGDPTLFANAVRVVGDGTTNPEIKTSFASGYARWDTEINLPLIDDQDLVEARAVRELADRIAESTSYMITLRDSEGLQAWGGPGDVGLGDTVRVVVKSGRWNLNEEMRVLGIMAMVDGSGRERVTLETGGRRRRIDDRQRELDRRVNELELLTE